MATTAGEVEQTTTGSESGSGSSGEGALSPEELRDIATFARNGMNPDGTPLTPQPQPKSEEDEEEEEDEVVEGDEDEEDEGTTAAEDEEDEDEEDELTDERLDRTVDALLDLDEDRIAKNPRVRARIEAEIREQVRQEQADRQRATTESQERERLTKQGRAAVDAMSAIVTKAQTAARNAAAELDKAFKGEDFNPQVLAETKFEVEELVPHLRTFAEAAAFDIKSRDSNALAEAFKTAVPLGGDLTPEEVDVVKSIVNTANRIEADEKQGDERWDKAATHTYVETVKFLVARAKEAGRREAIAEAKTKRDARKTVLDSDAVLAGAAKEAKRRGALPPAPTTPGVTQDAGAPTMEAYQAAKRAGQFDLADQIMRQMEAAVPQSAETRRRVRR